MKIKHKEEKSIVKNHPLQKIFLISNYFEEPKNKKNWFANQLQIYIKTIRQNVYNMTKEEKYDRLKKKAHYLSFSTNKLNQFPYIRNTSVKYLPIKKEKKIYLKQFNSNKKMNNSLTNNSDDISKNNSYIFNLDNNLESINNKTINKTIDTDVIREYSNIKSLKRNKFPFNNNLDLGNLPNIQGMENKTKYIKNNLNNISEKTEMLEKKLIKQEKKKYIGFKTKYNRIYNEHKKMQIDLEQYVNPRKDNKYKFNLYQNTGDPNETKMENLKLIMRQISNKLKNRQKNKPSLSDIIDEVENFKLKEKMLRDRIQKSHEKFNYLIHDSNTIQKRIDIKCQKNSEME